MDREALAVLAQGESLRQQKVVSDQSPTNTRRYEEKERSQLRLRFHEVSNTATEALRKALTVFTPLGVARL